MCNACNNLCCGSDEFGGCGCEHCGCDECLAPCYACGLIICDGDCQDDFDDFDGFEPILRALSEGGAK